VIAWALLNTDTTKSSTDMGCRRGCRRASAPRTQAAGGGGNLSTLTLPRVATSENTPAGREIGEGEPHEDGEPEEARAGKGDDQGPPLAKFHKNRDDQGLCRGNCEPTIPYP
jgi:hypothetical protein